MRRFWRRPSTDSARLERVRRRRERARKGLSLLPSALTLGNLVCGFAAIIRIALIDFDDHGVMTAASRDSLFYAGCLIFLAMVFDALDGRVARLTKSTSDFGGQLDSLCDAVTFGLTPGVMIVLLNPISRFEEGSFWGQVAWVFGVAYACGAILRLARFNVENSHDDSAHNSFEGLPTPAAAGVLASLALFENFLAGARGGRVLSALSGETRQLLADGLVFLMPFVALTLSYLMISRHRYVHVVNVYLRGRTHFDHLNRLLFFGALIALMVLYLPELVFVLAFAGFAASGPLRTLWRKRRGLPPESSEALAHEEDGEEGEDTEEAADAPEAPATEAARPQAGGGA